MDVRDLKLDDLYIIEEKPLRVKVGKKYILIKSLPLKEVDRYERMLVDLLLKWRTYLGNINILDYGQHKTPKRIDAFAVVWKRLLKKDVRFKRDVINLICKPYHVSPRYFKKHATYDLVTQCFLASQLINYDAVKKNLESLILKVGIIQEQPGFLDFSLMPTDGVKKKHLTPRY